MGHVSFMPHETLVTVSTSEREIPCMPAAMSNQLISISKHLLAKLASVPGYIKYLKGYFLI
jgi:hypothetical protein